MRMRGVAAVVALVLGAGFLVSCGSDDAPASYGPLTVLRASEPEVVLAPGGAPGVFRIVDGCVTFRSDVNGSVVEPVFTSYQVEWDARRRVIVFDNLDDQLGVDLEIRSGERWTMGTLDVGSMAGADWITQPDPQCKGRLASVDHIAELPPD